MNPTLPAQWPALVVLAVLGVVALLLGIVLAVGLFRARSLFRRELMAFFFSPVAYVVFGVFLLTTGGLFALTLLQLTASGPKGVEYPMRLLLGDPEYLLAFLAFWLVFLLIPALLTMRLFAEERSSGTLEMLMTSPLQDWQVVLSKYLACLVFYELLWLPTLVYLPVLLGAEWPVIKPVWTTWSILGLGGLASALVGLVLLIPRLGTGGRIVSLVLLIGGKIAALVGLWMHYHHDPEVIFWMPTQLDPRPVLTSYAGVLLTGAMFLAVGLWISSLVRSQIVAALVTVLVCLLFVLPGFFGPYIDSGSPLYQVLYYVSIPLHFHRDFTRGLVDSRQVVLYTSVAIFCLFLTVRSLESRRWQ